MNKTVKFPKPVSVGDKTIESLTLREPTGGDELELHEVRTVWERNSLAAVSLAVLPGSLPADQDQARTMVRALAAEHLASAAGDQQSLKEDIWLLARLSDLTEDQVKALPRSALMLARREMVSFFVLPQSLSEEPSSDWPDTPAAG